MERKFRLLVDNHKISESNQLDELYNEYKTHIGWHNDSRSIIEVNENDEFMRVISSIRKWGYEVAYECCPHCGDENPFYANFKAFHCPTCGKLILPCSLCDGDKADCQKCPLVGSKKKLLGGIIKTENTI